MKKTIASALVAVIFLGVLLFLPRASFADSDYCYDNWERCRVRAMESNEGWFRKAIMLTICDLALGKCLLLQK